MMAGSKQLLAGLGWVSVVVVLVKYTRLSRRYDELGRSSWSAQESRLEDLSAWKMIRVFFARVLSIHEA